jgi:glycosyltransferase 2 family protein
VTRSSKTAEVEFVRRRQDAIVAIIGVVILAIGMVLVRDSEVGDFEESVFDAINGLPQWLYPLMWPFQQVGALLVGPIVAIVAFVTHHRRLAAGALVVTFLKLVTERIVKVMVSRERPGTSIGDHINMRGDVSAEGESFVSGHAVMVAALAGIVSPYLNGRWKIVPWALVVMVMIGRVYVGAHNPLDVVCGAALGVAIAGVLNLCFGVPAPSGAGEPSHDG